MLTSTRSRPHDACLSLGTRGVLAARASPARTGAGQCATIPTENCLPRFPAQSLDWKESLRGDRRRSPLGDRESRGCRMGLAARLLACPFTKGHSCLPQRAAVVCRTWWPSFVPRRGQ